MNDKDIYVMMEMNYLKENNRSINDNNSDLFPLNWYRFSDYKLKTEILYESIKSKVKIINTKKYKSRGNSATAHNDLALTVYQNRSKVISTLVYILLSSGLT